MFDLLDTKTPVLCFVTPQTFTATDLGTTICVYGNFGLPTRFTLPPSKERTSVFKSLRSTPFTLEKDAETVTFAPEGPSPRVALHYGEMPVYEQAPSLKAPEDGATFDPAIFLKHAKELHPCVSKDYNKPNLMSAFTQAGFVYATDGHRAARIEVPDVPEMAHVPGESLKTAARYTFTQAAVFGNPGAGELLETTLYGPEGTVTFHARSERPPSVGVVFPSAEHPSWKGVWTFDAAEMRKSLKQIKPYTGNSRGVIFNEGSAGEIQTFDGTKVPCEGAQNVPFRFGIDAQYFLDALGARKGTVEVRMKDERSPFLFTPEHDGAPEIIVMPRMA